MWVENSVFFEDLKKINEVSYIDWEKLENSTVFVTGGTGLIGYTFIAAIAYRNIYLNSHIKVIALIRNLNKANLKFTDILKNENNGITFIEGSLENFPTLKGKIDYILHAGGPTSSKFFANYPVETIKITLEGTSSILALSAEKKIKSIVYLSSMEVYGTNHTAEKIDEKHASFLDTMVPRNSYPEAKRMAENLFASYAEEYGVPAKVVRLTQTFGPGISENDRRVFAQFINAAQNKKDIILLTEGTTKRNYLYTADAVTAILAVMLNGSSGEAYNAANENTFCSIREMADLVANKVSHNMIKVKIQPGSTDELKAFLPPMIMNLSTKKLQALGWQACVNLDDMYARTIRSMNCYHIQGDK